MIDTKALARFEVKAADSETRTFEGLASTWDLDLGGDVIHKGAFRETLKDWRSTGRVIPLIDQHNYFSVRHVLGKLIDAEERAEGLWTKWRVTEGQDGDELLHRLRAGIIDGLSIGYQVEEAEDEVVKGRTIRHLKQLGLREVSAVIWGMNPGALVDTRSVKGLLAGVEPDALSDEDRKELRGLASRIGQLLRPRPDPADTAAALADGEQKQEPDAAPAADAAAAPPKADEEQPAVKLYGMEEALRQRLARLRIKDALTGELQ